jgi:hypothetical protein
MTERKEDEMKKIILISALLLIGLYLVFRVDADFGRCLDASGNGKLYNGEEFYNYISYSGTGAEENDIVFTVCILNPFGTSQDDIICRFDWVVLKDAK